ncbi:MAG: ABC transporter permease [Oscillospiraceae bacterium]|nr:ABC transporter permease [Oscillospiraceae bacterium]
MYILHHALKNLIRNKGRNILIGLVLTAIIAASVVGLVINNTASAVIDNYRTRFGSRVSFTRDLDVARIRHNIPPDGFMKIDVTIPPEQILAFAESQYLMRYYLTAMKNTHADDMTAIGEVPVPQQTQDQLDELQARPPQFRVLGNLFDEFETGERFLLEGHMPRDGEALIGQEFAELNGLSVGDEITVTARIRPVIADGFIDIPTTLTISGIFVDFTEDIPKNPMFGGFVMPNYSRRNEILTTTDTLLNSIEQHSNPYAFLALPMNATYYLRDPAYLPYFEAELREKGLDYMYLVSTDEAGFNTIVEPVEGLRFVLFVFTIVVLGLGAVILILVSTIAIRERNYEIGVLRAMGMKKGKVTRGLLFEMCALTIICLVLGLALGNIAAQPVADNLLQQQVEIAIAAAPTPVQTGMEALALVHAGPLLPPEAEPLSEISLHLGAVTMVQIAAIALLLAFVASAIGLVNIMRFEPIKILMERDR